MEIIIEDTPKVEIDNNVKYLRGPKGEEAKINGHNTINIVAGENVEIKQEDDMLEISATGGGSVGTSDYEKLEKKPKINDIELTGNKSLKDLGIKQDYTASDIKFQDGETFQQKYNNGELKGEPGKNGTNGIDGKDGIDGTNGITPTIGDNGNWYLGDEDTGKSSKGEPGQPGTNGHTPIKGTDYFTQAEIQEFTNIITSNVNQKIGLVLDTINGEVI